MKPCRVFLTGEPGCGKTTAIRETCEILTSHGRRVGGVLSGEIREQGIRVGFSLEDINTREVGTLAHVNWGKGPRLGKYCINLDDIQRIAVGAIKHAIGEADVIVVDELGPMELHSSPFILAIEMALATPTPIIGTIHKRASHHLVAAIKANKANEILEVTYETRDNLPRSLVQRIEAEIP